ncbi:DUF3426 domain-containing protein [Bordetella sp. BOR01]|uniref:DUF3426 domain-containing protein n=1 Tax=Bordetella sp. BOR01 TaxID=2854779 RepID=UPI001C437865|nr:DUF3426 domain-containing protein [Bordetella sp. BOR01]MBV7484340.1 zinc-ribbon domain-containing protein [Bordetella sp. BOR01]
MAMTTRCPQCGTAFKVVPDQLRVRNGLVRCGACATVFDGRACLVAQIPQADPSARQAPPAAGPLPESESESVSAPSPIRPIADPAAAPIPHLSARPEPSLGASPAVLRGRSDIRRHDPYVGQATEADDLDAFDDEPTDDDEPTLRAEPVAAGPGVRIPLEAGTETPDADAGMAEAESESDAPHVTVQPAVLGEARTRYYGATDVGRTPPEFLDTDRQDRRHLLRSLWGYACVLGLLLLALQLVYVYRSAIATAAPPLRPLLASLCQPLGCQIGYARRIERIFITSSSLQPPRGQAGASARDDLSSLVLRVSLRNRYDKPQHWPALLLDLTDLSDTVVVRKVLRPEDYLSPSQAAGPFEPGAEINIEVPIDVSGAHVNGYQLDKFFP